MQVGIRKKIVYSIPDWEYQSKKLNLTKKRFCNEYEEYKYRTLSFEFLVR